MLSLLGIIVFPWEHDSFRTIGEEALEQSGGSWNIAVDTYKKKCINLGHLIWHLRNAVSHRRIIFSSDSRDIADVSIEFSDEKNRQLWLAKIKATDLKTFCLNLL